MKYQLLADSGSTKTDWLVLRGSDRVQRFSTQGINPYMLDTEEMVQILRTELLPHLEATSFSAVEFYGAGCRGEQCERVRAALLSVLVADQVLVASDMLGAARALCGKETGIVCILGTGSNSCLYDGREIIENVSPLGFILGDEGSGAVLGRRLLGDVLKKQLPESIIQSFFEDYPITTDEIIRRVYRETFPNRFLAGFCPFLSRHRFEAAIHALLVEEFSRFFTRNVANYGKKDLPVHFVGSVAYYFREELEQAAVRTGFRLGNIQKAPWDQFG